MVVSGRSRGRGGTQHIASFIAENTATSCVSWQLRAGVSEEDPELTEIGSASEKKGINTKIAIIIYYCCHIGTIVQGAIIIIFYC